MSLRLLVATFLAALVASSTFTACDDSGPVLGCVDLCSEAQAGNCTFITGNCGDFCSALTNVQGDASCTDERESYESCLNSDAVCDASCDDEEGALTNCLITFCIANSSNADCATLTASLN